MAIKVMINQNIPTASATKGFVDEFNQQKQGEMTMTKKELRDEFVENNTIFRNVFYSDKGSTDIYDNCDKLASGDAFEFAYKLINEGRAVLVGEQMYLDDEMDEYLFLDDLFPLDDEDNNETE